MKVLLDENVTKYLKKDLSDEHEVYTVRDKKWESYSNGELLKKMIEEGFDLLPGVHPIVPVMFSSEHVAAAMAKALFERGIYEIGRASCRERVCLAV